MLITIVGSGPGISRGVARKFGKNGFSVALIARNESKLQEEVKLLESEGIQAIHALADVSDADSLNKAFENIKERAGLADVTLFNASGFSVKDVLDQDWSTFQQVFDISVGGAFHTAKWVLPKYLSRNSGKLFLTGGGSALMGDPQWTTLGVAKAGMRNLAQALAKKVEGTSVHVSSVVVCGYVNETDPKYNPDAIAEQYWALFTQKPGEFVSEIIY